MLLEKTRLKQTEIPWLVILLCVLAASPLYAGDKQTIGWVEKVAISDHDIVLSAKIDTGAKHSSLNAPDLRLFNKKGESWVKFSVAAADGKKIEFEEPVVRMTKIKRKGYRSQLRPVIHMKICLANMMSNVEVNLVDRENFEHPILVGRSFLRGRFVVDVSKRLTSTPHCIKSPDSGAIAVPR